MQQLMATTTGTTCGMACWSAREEVCRCSCSGRNHGAMRDGGAQPERTKTVKGTVYRLVAVTTYIEADRLVHVDYGDWLRSVGRTLRGHYPHERMLQNMATASQMKWYEVQNTDVGLNHHGRPEDKHLVWERIDAPRTW